MKLLGLNFLSELYLLGIGTSSENSRLQKEMGSFVSRILIFGGIAIGLTAFLPDIYSIVGMIIIVLVLAIISFIVVTRLKKNII
ncbi:hypothetical protein [Oceanobacillus neutriphilus]|uniref:DUF3784 domain-containing protein n=1 Tax=Oceanobacillus neutriphilus TaxID=531815 RepID=A0ABQ2NUA0_9BACI|nr:hypothetical protein [Oceanobacillus neutriphilus]GGP10679.1 hypothetical protein GCM10011346_19770 [Oceanobacillus neutriphilus]